MKLYLIASCKFTAVILPMSSRIPADEHAAQHES